MHTFKTQAHGKAILRNGNMFRKRLQSLAPAHRISLCCKKK